MTSGQPVERIYAEVGFNSTLDKDLSGLSTGLNKAQSQVEKFGKSVSSGLGSSISGLGSQFSQIGTNFSNSLGGAFEKAGQKIQSFGTVLSNGVGNAFKTVGNEASLFGTNISKSIGSAFDGAGEKIKSFGGNVSNSLGTSLSSIGQKVTAIGTSISQNFGSSISGIGEKISSIGSTISSGIGNAFSTVSNTISNFGSTVKDKISTAFSSARESIANFSTSAVSSFNSLVTVGQNVVDKLGLIGVAAVALFTNELKNAISGAAEEFYKFDDVMRQVQAVTSTSGGMFDALTQSAQDYGAATSFTTKEVADAMVIMGQQGFSANEIMSSIGDTLNLSRASMTGLSTTVDIMTSTMRAFNISADETSRVSDVMSKTANSTATDVTGLGEAMKYTSALAYQMGWSLEETAAAAGLLSNAGIKNSMAGTVLRNAITRLIAPTEKAVGIMNSYGISLEMVDPKVHSLADILDVLGAHTVSSGDLMEIFGMRAGPGMMALVNQGTDALRKEIDVIKQSGGYAQEAANQMDAGLGGAIRQIQGSLENLSISVGRAVGVIFTPLLNAGTALINVLAKIPTPFLAIGVVFASLTVAAGTLLVALAALPTVAGVLTAGLSVASAGMFALGEAIFTATGSAVLLGPVLSLATVPIAAIVASVSEFVIVGAALAVVIYEIEDKTHILSNSWAVLNDLFTIAAHDVKELFGSMGDVISNWLDDIKTAFADTGIEQFITTLEDAYNEVSSFFGGIQSSVHDQAEDIRAEEDKAALSAKNVAKSISDSQNGVVSSYTATKDSAGNSYADMIKQATEFSDGATGANEDVISSNGDLITSTDKVTSSVETLQKTASKGFTLGETNISNIFSDKPKDDLTDINKGIELADGSMLTFNKSGELVIQTVEGITKKVSELASMNLETSSGSKIGIISQGTKSLYNNEPTKTVSLEQAGQNAVKEEAYMNSAAYKQKLHASQLGYTVLQVDQPIPQDQYFNTQEQAKVGTQWTKPIVTPSSTVKIKTLKDSEENIQAAARETTDEYKKRLKEYNRTGGKSGTGNGGETKADGSLTTFAKNMFSVDGPGFGTAISQMAGGFKDSIGKGLTDLLPDTSSIKNLISGVADYNNEASIAGTTTQSWNDTFKNVTGIDLSGIVGQVMDVTKNSSDADKEAGNMGQSISSAGMIDLSGLYNAIFGVGDQETVAAGKADEHKGVLDTLGSVSFSGLVDSIFGVGTEQETSAGKATDHKGILDTLNGISMDGIIGQIFGIGSEQDTSGGKGTTHSGILDLINKVTMGSVIGQIFGIGGEQEVAGGKGTTHQGILDIINGTSMGGIIGQVFGIGTEQDTAGGKGTGHQTILNTINATSMGSIIAQIFGIGNESDTSKIKGDLLKGAYDLVNQVSLSSLLGQIGGVGTVTNIVSGYVSSLHTWIAGLNNISLSSISSTIDGLITKAQNMYSTVSSYASKASDLIFNTSSNKSAAPSGIAATPSNTTIKVNTVNQYGNSTSVSNLRSVI